ncbi:unnamed protein product [Notodromas monacha]|uniref:Sas10 C-terminal domain-containing protein n=1 Tax=Notodromas monacha TaxID=399045 RepID=A0A7R9BIU5_9CRUS|nr:unnamed protein product [Notodromas monacha]CAG0915497.1 unnamed protein product [Notodromas monacha]
MKGKKGRKGAAKPAIVESDEDDDDDVPDPTREDFVYDAVDLHSASKSKTVERSDEEEESDDAGDRVVGFKDLGFEDTESEDDEFYEEQLARVKRDLAKDENASDIESVEDDEEEDGRRGTDAWGRRMTDFRGADVVDPTNEALLQMEEEEAAALRSRIAKDFDEADFDIGQLLPSETSSQKKTKKKKKQQQQQQVEGDEELSIKEPRVERDLSTLSRAQKLELVKQESPELIHLLQDFQAKLKELKTKLEPALKNLEISSKKSGVFADYVRLKFDLTSWYCVNMSFYMALKSNRTPVTNHPIIKRLLGIRKLLKELEPADEKFDSAVEMLSQQKSLPEIVEAATAGKLVQASLNEDMEEEEEQVGGEEEETDTRVNPWEVEDGEKRAITYQIAKNKGLTPHKKKELRNPRVKHRMKYRKAKIRRKGQVREVRNEVSRYGGEMSGIRAGVVKSVKFK